jgi:integrase
MLYRLQKVTGIICNPHTLRRTFASNLHRAGLDVEHIMRLGGWESLDMVLRYTRSEVRGEFEIVSVSGKIMPNATTWHIQLPARTVAQFSS